MKKRITVLTLLLFLFACSSNGVKPKEAYNLKYEFYSEKNYQQIYRTILNNADSCTKNVGFSKSIAEGQLFSDIKAADVSILQQSFMGKYPHIRVKIEASDNKTKIIVTNDYQSWDEFAKAIQEWVAHDTELCR